MYLSEKEILDRIEKDWHGHPMEVITCKRILSKLLGEDLLRFDLGEVARGLNSDGRSILKVMPYLTGDRINLLEMRFEFIEEGGTYPLSYADVRIAKEQQILLHPINKEPVEDFDAKVFIYFVPSVFARLLRGEFESQIKFVREMLSYFLACQTDYPRKDICSKLFVRRWAIVHGSSIRDEEAAVVWCDRGDLL